MRQIPTDELVELDASEMAAVNGGEDPVPPPPTLTPGGDGLTDALVNWFKEKIIGPLSVPA